MAREDEKQKYFTPVAILVLRFKVCNTSSFSARGSQRLGRWKAWGCQAPLPWHWDRLHLTKMVHISALPCPFLATTMAGLGGYHSWVGCHSWVLGHKAEDAMLRVHWATSSRHSRGSVMACKETGAGFPPCLRCVAQALSCLWSCVCNTLHFN